MNATRRHMPMRHIRQVHFIGIGGAGMSGIAEVLCGLGYTVSGSDLKENAQTRRLRELGANIRIGHEADAVAGADVVVVSSAVPPENPEWQAAQVAHIPVVPRAAMLGELMRFSHGIAVAGTHGKTTTTSLIAHLLTEAGLGPSSIIGGRVQHSGSHATLGEGDYLVCEADESDASFLHLSPLVAVVTNIDNDHLVNYDGDIEKLAEAYYSFLQNLPFYGLAVLCADDPRLAALRPNLGRQTVTYGIETPDADLHATGIEPDGSGSVFTLQVADSGEELRVCLALPGTHNVLNALAAVAVARDLGVPLQTVAQALEGFSGIARRFEAHGPLPGGDDIPWVDDYGHHPTEIEATLATARQVYPDRRQVLVFQPHRYTRTRDLFESMVQALGEADALLLLDVYPAGEAPIPGADSDSLARALEHMGTQPVRAAGGEQLFPALLEILRPGDVLLTMGAGSIEGWAAQLPAQFTQREAS